MTGPVLANIYLGNITNWNDAAIAKLNPSANLPEPEHHAGLPLRRLAARRYNFTDYLSAVEPEWKARSATRRRPAFPTGVGAAGSAGVAGVVTRTEGALAYVDIAYAIKNHIRVRGDAEQRRASSLYPSLRRIKAAAATVKKVPANNEMLIVNPPKTKRDSPTRSRRSRR